MSEQPPADLPPPGFVPVCAIGASAGGVGALQTLFRLLPDDLGLAYVVVVHLSPDHPSAMHEILGACTRMPVFQVNDGPTLRANCVYVIAPDSELVIDGDSVQSRPFTDPQGRRAPIDMFFRSIAAGRGDGIAVVLTGAGSDGALGVRAIKEAGGIVMVQEPAEAGFPSMPQNAIATGVADVVAPLARLAERIADAAHSKEAVRSLDEDGAANDVRRIVAFLRTRTGHDFSGYKRSTVLRRIQRRMQVCQIAGLADYLQYLRVNPEEAKELLSDLLISVTMFFRDPATFVTLSQYVIRPLLESRSAGDTEGEIRAWVVGCATGEEAYSLAILLLEEAERLKVNVPIQIFATDLDEGALATAREGRYPRSIEADVSAERLKRFFVDEGTHYRIDRKVRDLVLFAMHSVVREPPFMRLDVITCRNVLIYLERALQNHVNSIFRYGLKAEGYLFLGTAETADTSGNHFAVVDREARIYRALPARPEFVPTLAAPGPWSAGRPALTESRLAVARFDAAEVLGESHAAALEVSAPPSALVDVGQAVLHLSPTAGRFILLSAGPLSGRLPSIVRPELRLDLKLALDRTFDSQQPTITRPIDVLMEGETRRVSLHASPLPTGEGAAPRAIVYFLDSGPGRTEGAVEPAPPPDELQHLHSELKVAQEAEVAGRIRHESAVQELRASNEELQSLNEEYRSTAEELETSKEELQSINEELQTVNAELKSKLGIISAAHNDLQNLTASSEIGTLFLDLDLRIRMFTPRVAELINVANADVGRPVTNFTHRLEYDDIAADVRRVSRDLTPLEKEVRTVDGRWFTVRIRPYQTLDGKVEGAVVTFDDNTDRMLARAALGESEEKYRSLFETIDEGFTIIEMVRNDDGRLDFIYREVNRAFARVTGFQPNPGQRAREMMPDIEDEWLAYYDRVTSSGVPEQKEGFQIDAARWYRTNATRLGDVGSPLLAVAFEDVSPRKRAEQVLRESESWLAAQKDAFRAAMDDAPLDRSLGILAAWMDENADGARRCAFYMAGQDGDGLRHVVGMTADYAQAVDGFATSPESLAYGLAASTGQPVITPDVLGDPAWREWTWLADAHGYRACWSFPVETATGKLIGSFAEYLPEPREPTARDFELVAALTQAAAIILSRYRENEERTRAEAALRESEERFQALFAGSPVPFMVLAPNAPDFTITGANDAYLAATLTTRDGLIGRRLFEVFTDDPDRPGPLGSEALALSLARVLASRRTDAMERVRYDMRTPAGGFVPHWWLAINAPLLDASGEVGAIIHQVTRVTDLHRAEQVEREHRERQAFLLQLSDALRSLESAADIERASVDLLGAKLGLSRAYYGMIGEDGDTVTVRHVYADGVDAEVGGPSLSAYRAGLHAAWHAGRMTVVADSETDPLLGPADRALYASVSARGAVGMPLVKRGRLAAVLAVNQSTPRVWTDQETSLIAEVAERTWIAIERARAEAALREREADLARVQQIGGVGGLDIDVAAGMTSRRSPEYLRLHGLPPETQDETHADWRARIHPEDVEDAERLLLSAIASEAHTYASEYRIIRPDNGAVRWIAARADIERDADGTALRLVGAHIDITAQKRVQEALRESEERFTQFAASSSDALWIRDAGTLTMEYTSAAIAPIYGVAPEALLGDPERWLTLILPEDRDTALKHIQAAQGGEAVVHEFRIRRPSDGEVRWIRNTDFPLRDEHGRVQRIGGLAEDVTDAKALQERQGVLTAELQHRTRNLMGVVRSMVGTTLERSADLADFRDRFSNRLAALARVQGLLSRLDDWDRVTFDELIDSEISALDGEAERITLDGPKGVALRSSTVQTFALAVHELMTNALKYGALAQPRGRLAIAWRLDRSANDARPWLHVTWRESGVAMPPGRAKSEGGGSGRTLIERALPYQLGARTTFVMEADGVHCTIAMPVSERQATRGTDDA